MKKIILILLLGLIFTGCSAINNEKVTKEDIDNSLCEKYVAEERVDIVYTRREHIESGLKEISIEGVWYPEYELIKSCKFTSSFS